MRIRHGMAAAADPPDRLLGRMLGLSRRARPAGGGCHRGGRPGPAARRPGSPLDWRDILTRLAPVRRRWDLAILANLEEGIDRPVDLVEMINNQAGDGQQLSPQVLSSRLRRLEEAGYIGHEEISRIPRRRSYRLLPRGRRLIDALDMLGAWYDAQEPYGATGTDAAQP